MIENTITPQDPRELNAKAVRALAGGDAGAALALLELAKAADSGNAVIWLNLAAARRSSRDSEGAMAALDHALALRPRFFQALLMRGSLLEERGKLAEAALTYGNALTQAPPSDQLDDGTRKAVRHAQQVNQAFAARARAHVADTLASAASSSSGPAADRVRLFVDHALGLRRIYRQEPTQFHYPGLPSIEFYEREEFPFLEDLEAKTEVIQGELEAVIRSEEGFQPYVDYPDSTPMDQWGPLNRSPAWKAFHFYHQGRRYDANCARCPQTVEALAPLGQPRVPHHMPAAMFSVLQAETHIPAHVGVANVRLVLHLPIIVPPRCGFRVGNSVRAWERGRAWVFDDTVEHEAWNESDQVRIILIADLWNPSLSERDRELIAIAMGALHDAQHADAGPMPP